VWICRLWDVDCGACLRILEGHEELVRCIRFDNKRIVSGAYDGLVSHLSTVHCCHWFYVCRRNWHVLAMNKSICLSECHTLILLKWLHIPSNFCRTSWVRHSFLQCFDTVGWLVDRKGLWKAGCWFAGGDDLTGALHVLQLQLSPPSPSSLLCQIKSRMETFWYWLKLGSAGKWLLMCRHFGNGMS